MIHRNVAYLFVFSLVLVSTAHADVTSARQHFQRGKVLFDLQKYLEAAHEYEAAYEAKDDPALLFNIGQSYRLGGEYQKALGAYRSYLRNVANAPNRAEVQSRIEDMQRALDDQRRNHDAPSMGTLPPPAPAVEPKPGAAPPEAHIAAPALTPSPVLVSAPLVDHRRRGRVLLTAGIATGAVGLAALAAGVALEVVAKSNNDKFDHPAAGTVFSPSLESSVKTDQAAGLAMLVVGGAACATGVTLTVLGLRSRRAQRAQLSPMLAPTVAGIAASGRF